MSERADASASRIAGPSLLGGHWSCIYRASRHPVSQHGGLPPAGPQHSRKGADVLQLVSVLQCTSCFHGVVVIFQFMLPAAKVHQACRPSACQTRSRRLTPCERSAMHDLLPHCINSLSVVSPVPTMPPESFSASACCHTAADALKSYLHTVA